MKSKFLGHSANDLFWFILPLILPTLLIRYDLSYSQAGSILTLYLLITALGSFFIGRLSDRCSQKRILSYGLIFAAFGLMASGFASSLPAFLLLISVTAVGVSTFHPVMYAVLDEHFPVSKGKVMSWYETSGSLAILLMFLINGFLLEKVGVRAVMILTALPALIMGVYYLFSSAIPASGIKNREKSDCTDFINKRDQFQFALYLFSIILRVMSIAALLNFLPTILVGFLNFNRSMASYATAFYFGGGIAGSLTAGRLSERFNPLLVLCGGVFMILPCLLAFTLTLPVWAYLAVISLFGFFGSGCIIPQNLLMTDFGKHLGKGEVFGILIGTLTVASALSPTLFGLTIDHWGMKKAIFLFSLPLLGAGGALLSLLKNRERKISVSV